VRGSSSAAHNVGIAVLSIIIIALVIVVSVLVFRRFARRRRRLQHFLASVKPSVGGSNSAVNFVTMMEEPDWQPHERQLEILGTPPATAS